MCIRDRRSGQGHVILRVATLDETPLQKPESHIFKSQFWFTNKFLGF